MRENNPYLRCVSRSSRAATTGGNSTISSRATRCLRVTYGNVRSVINNLNIVFEIYFLNYFFRKYNTNLLRFQVNVTSSFDAFLSFQNGDSKENVAHPVTRPEEIILKISRKK